MVIDPGRPTASVGWHSTGSEKPPLVPQTPPWGGHPGVECRAGRCAVRSDRCQIARQAIRTVGVRRHLEDDARVAAMPSPVLPVAAGPVVEMASDMTVRLTERRYGHRTIYSPS